MLTKVYYKNLKEEIVLTIIHEHIKIFILLLIIIGVVAFVVFKEFYKYCEELGNHITRKMVFFTNFFLCVFTFNLGGSFDGFAFIFLYNMQSKSLDIVELVLTLLIELLIINMTMNLLSFFLEINNIEISPFVMILNLFVLLISTLIFIKIFNYDNVITESINI